MRRVAGNGPAGYVNRMSKTPTARLEDIEQLVERLGDSATPHWAPGRCPYLTETQAVQKAKDAGAPRSSLSVRVCSGTGHPTDCDGAFEQGEFAPFPMKPSAKMVADAVDTFRADVAEGLKDLLELVRSQQQQIGALSTKYAGHRHKVAEGHFSDRAET